MVEVLAPAGSIEHLRAAVFGGADAVYLGTKEFSARQSAENFTISQLEEAVRFCHERNVNVYVAVNTVVKSGELETLADLAKNLSKVNVDAVIIQDLAAMEIFQRVSPQMPLHASTQMAIHNLSGAKALRDLGFSRVVLARELTFDEIKIITEKCGIETEVFVHGAHCMSASGMCYLSSFIGGRSGNRGRCAQPCRLDFRAGKEINCLSLKDMCYIEHIKKLEAIGVSSLKIEGRMKRPEYAYISSKTYKKAVCGEKTEHEIKLLKGVFSRSGFTDGYITGKRNIEMFGYRKKEDVEASSTAIKEIGKLEELKKIPVDITLEIRKDKPMKVVFSSGNVEASILSDEIITEKTKLPAEKRIEESLRKTGGTPFLVESFHADVEISTENEDSVFPISALNALRREGLEKLSSLLAHREEKKISDYVLPENAFKRRECKEIRIRLENAEQAEKISVFDGKIIVPPEEAEKLACRFNKSQIIIEIPFLVYPCHEEKLLSVLKGLHEKGFESVICENISFVKKLYEIGFSVHGGGYMNVINPLSLFQYEKIGVCDMTLSVEINGGELNHFGNECKTGIISYGFLPLMQFRNCPLKARIGCDACGGKSFLTDRLNNRFPVICKKGYVSLLNTVPLSLSDKKMNVDFQTLYFTNEAPERVAEIIKSFREGKEPNYPHTKGLYFRKVL